ncbi:MAG: hypothetical protein M1836_006108 [Candelina mexicana]|nr:MAG: hypothetical protein M1836_006108 [Candelina mexicana]
MENLPPNTSSTSSSSMLLSPTLTDTTLSSGATSPTFQRLYMGLTRSEVDNIEQQELEAQQYSRQRQRAIERAARPVSTNDHSYRIHPYQRLASNGTHRPRYRQSPTSAPSFSSTLDPALLSYDSLDQRPPVERYIFQNPNPETTLSLGILEYLARLKSECAAMEQFVRTGFSSPVSSSSSESDESDNDEDQRQRRKFEFESICLHNRTHNTTHVTELNEPLLALPLLSNTAAEIPIEAPSSAQDVKDMDHSAMDTLLDIYALPFNPSMFLCEKKAIYLRFVGAGRAVMHRVLD